jgi:hypothetical protein
MQMFVETPRDAKYTHLHFFRWLVERDQLEHAVFGPPCGAYAPAPVRAPVNPACVPRWFGR